MDRLRNHLKILFQVLSLLLIVFYLYPGGILGFLVYGDFKLQPKITADFYNISSNHFYTFLIISLLGLFSYFKDIKFKMVVIYLFFLAIVLELFHLIIPERGFQIPDLIGNIFGVLLAFFLIMLIKFWSK